jgi:cytochrome P450
MGEVSFNPMDPEFIADPYPTYHRLRTEDPVHLSPLGFWVLTRYEDVVSALRDPRLAKEAIAAFVAARFGVDVPPGIGLSMLDRDPPDHTRLRGLVSKAFTPRVVEGLRPHIQQIVDGLLDAVVDAKAMDLVEEFAYPLPVIVICEMLGVPVEDRERFKGWGVDIARGLDAIMLPPDSEVARRSMTSRRALANYFRELIAERRAAPRGDLLSALIAAEEAGDKLSEDELLSTCVLLLVAGHETTVNLIGNGTLALLRNPRQLRRLRENPALIASAVEELLRYDGPAGAARDGLRCRRKM